MIRFLLALVWLMAASGRAAELPPKVTEKSPLRLWVDQLGYRTNTTKFAILASDQPLPPLDQLPMQLIDARTGKVFWTAPEHVCGVALFRGGKRDAESGEFTAFVDMTDFNTPGRYYLTVKSGDRIERSAQFDIGADVYREAAIAAWRAFYFNRADTELPEKFAGPWHHKLAHRGPHQSTEALVYKWTGNKHWDPVGQDVADPTPHDVHGGWWDGGNFDKYIGNTTLAHDDLLLCVQLLGELPPDGALHIPESGNGIPDMLDEIRCGTEFLLRMADESGAAFGRVYEKPACPPDADTSPVMLTQIASGATMNRAAALAYANLVWQERKLDPAFAKRCLDASLQSWKLLEKRPHPWPVDAADPTKPAPAGEWFFADYDRSRALAAACYFKLTGDKQFDAVVHDVAAKWDKLVPGEDADLYPVIWVYAHTPGADAELVKKFKQLIFAGADAAVKQTGTRRGYAAGLKVYATGSNRLIGACGVNCLLAAEFTDDAYKRQDYLDAAEEFLHYLRGRNPLGLCYLTNMKRFGAERSVTVMFHRWLGNPEMRDDPLCGRFIGEGPGKIGPPPGFVVAGANGGIKQYNDTLDNVPWDFNEPGLAYQSACTTLLSYFAWKAR